VDVFKGHEYKNGSQNQNRSYDDPWRDANPVSFGYFIFHKYLTGFIAGYFLPNWIPCLRIKYPLFLESRQQNKSLELPIFKINLLFTYVTGLARHLARALLNRKGNKQQFNFEEG